ncbi:fungal-specific transcription factor domain-domain-containing protein, partial [Phakopsora pachyrhizi]
MIPATKRKRTANACSRCRTRKQRCDGFSLPCKNCARAGTECTFPEDASGERLLREHISVLEAKVNSLSVALKFHEPNHPILNSIENSNLSKNLLTTLANGIGFLSLTSGAEPLYVGGSSGASWGRIFSATKMNSKQASRFDSRSLSTSNHSSLRPPNSDSNSFPQNPPYYFSVSGSTGLSKESSKSSRIPYHLSTMFVFPSLLAFKPVSDQIFETVYSTIQARHCFMNFPKLKEWYDQRDKYCGQSEEVFDSESRTAAFFLWLSYALGLRLWEGQGRSLEGLPSYEHCFEAALQYFDRVESNTTTIQAFLLLAMFSYRSDKGLSAWHLGGLAMRTALELGLHRKTPKGKRTDPFTEEMRKRVWWSVYSLDRTMAMQLGRPIAIRDKEIDTELPLDIDCHITDPKEILSRRQAIDKALSDSKTNLDSNPYPLGCTSMSFSLHFIRLRIVLTKVKEKIYDDKPQRESHRTLQSDTQRSELDSLLSELEHWKNTIPTTKEQGKETESRPGSCFKENDQTESKSHAWKPEGIPFYSLEWFDLQLAIQTLLIPYSITAPLEDPYLKRAVQSATLSCKLQRNRVKHGSLAPLSLYSLHKLFMSGAFLIYASNRHRDFLNSEISIESDLMNNGHSQKNSKKRIKNSHSQDVYNTPDPIHACREVLKVYSSHYQTIQPYYKFYEQI